MKKIALIAAALTTVALMSGCSSDQLKQDIADAKAAAVAAQQSADAAAAAADAAASTAANAEAKADQALGAAQGSQSCCDANGQKIDRMFHKAMLK